MRRIALLLVALMIVLCFTSCEEGDVDRILERLPYDIEGWHEHSWDNWELVYDEVNVNIVCSVCKANVKNQPISQGLEIEGGVLVGIGSCTDNYIVVPEGVRIIGEEAFANTKQIFGVLLPKTVAEIKDRAFKNCDGLQVINIPEGVTDIGNDVFFACKALIGVLIPHSVTSIGDHAFGNCGYLEIIYYVGTEDDWINVQKGKNWNQGAGKHVVEFKMIVGDDPLVKPSEFSQGLEYALNEDEKSYSVVGIGTCTDLDIVIPDTHKGLPVTAIAERAFYGNRFITSITASENIKSIGMAAFYNCTAVKSVYIPDTLEFLGEYAFHCCYELNSVSLGANLESIKEYTFFGCVRLKEMIIPDNITSIGSLAFYCCGFEKLTIGSGLKSIAKDAFYSCERLITIEVDDENKYFTDFEGVLYSKNKETLILYPGSIGRESVKFPESLKTVNDYSFSSIKMAPFYVYFDGTVEQWNSIVWNADWCAGRQQPTFCVVFSDGNYFFFTPNE